MYLGQLPLSDRQRINREKSARILQDLVAASALPLHTESFTLQLSELDHTWSARCDVDIDLFDVLTLAGAVYIVDSTLLQQPQALCALSALFTAIAELLAMYQPHNAPMLHGQFSGVSRVGGPKVRACHSYACCLDSNLRSLGRTTALVAVAPEPQRRRDGDCVACGPLHHLSWESAALHTIAFFHCAVRSLLVSESCLTLSLASLSFLIRLRLHEIAIQLHSDIRHSAFSWKEKLTHTCEEEKYRAVTSRLYSSHAWMK